MLLHMTVWLLKWQPDQGLPASLSPSCMQTPPRWILYHELVLTSKEYARTVTEIKQQWLTEIAPHMYNQNDIQDETGKKVPKVQGRAAIADS